MPGYVLSGQAPLPVHALVLVRGVLRSCRRYPEADVILRLLEAVGARVDDKVLCWSVAPAPVVPLRVPLPPDAPRCTACGMAFASRNLLFRHLREPANGCNTDMQRASLAPEAGRRRSRPAASGGQAAPTTMSVVRTATSPIAEVAVEAERCLWFGELPQSWAAQRPLQALIWALGPRGLPHPWVRKVVRRPRRGRPYAIVAFRDEAEAEAVLLAMDGLHVTAAACFKQSGDANPAESSGGPAADSDATLAWPSFVLCVKRCEHGSRAATASLAAPASASAGADPPLADQLRPLSVGSLWDRAEALLRACAVADGVADGVALGSAKEIAKICTLPALDVAAPSWRVPLKHEALSAALAAYDVHGGRREVRVSGQPLPAALAARMLAELQGLRWPARPHREHVTSERYLVLHPDARSAPPPTDEYAPLRALCAELVAFADPAFAYSGIAVTRNFVGSPHVDACDTSAQLAVSFGDFDEPGGELCVDGGDVLFVVRTKQRVARVDGRHVHWVRTHTGGDRFSVVLYDTTSSAPTPRGAPVELHWIAEGLRRPSGSCASEAVMAADY